MFWNNLFWDQIVSRMDEKLKQRLFAINPLITSTNDDADGDDQGNGGSRPARPKGRRLSPQKTIKEMEDPDQEDLNKVQCYNASGTNNVWFWPLLCLSKSISEV